VWCAPVDKNHLIRTRRNMKQKKVKNNKKIICIKKVRPIDIVVNLEVEFVLNNEIVGGVNPKFEI